MRNGISGKTGVERIGLYALAAAAALLVIVLVLRHRNRPMAKTAPPAAAPAADVGQLLAGLEARLRADPRDGAGWRMLGWSYFGLGRYHDAARAYGRGAALLPDDAALWSSLGEARVLAGEGRVRADAAQAFDRALAVDPKDARARYFLAVRKDVAGDHRAAIADWIAILRDAPSDAPYARSIRALVEQVAAREKIDLKGRLPAEGAAPAASGPDAAEMAGAARLSPEDQAAMARTMVDRLAARLAAAPRDEAGWTRLMRARLVLGDRAGAATARDAALRAFADDAAIRKRLRVVAGELGLDAP